MMSAHVYEIRGFEEQDEAIIVNCCLPREDGEPIERVSIRFQANRIAILYRDEQPVGTLELGDTVGISGERTNGGRWSSDEWIQGYEYHYSLWGGSCSLTLIDGEDRWTRHNDPDPFYPSETLIRKLARFYDWDYGGVSTSHQVSGSGLGQTDGPGAFAVTIVFVIIAWIIYLIWGRDNP